MKFFYIIQCANTSSSNGTIVAASDTLEVLGTSADETPFLARYNKGTKYFLSSFFSAISIIFAERHRKKFTNEGQYTKNV